MASEVYMNGKDLAEFTKSTTGSMKLPVGWT